MPSINLNHVPDDVQAILRRRAAASGKSLEEYVAALLTNEARAPTNEECSSVSNGTLVDESLFTSPRRQCELRATPVDRPRCWLR
jgi:plasmid stability protein